MACINVSFVSVPTYFFLMFGMLYLAMRNIVTILEVCLQV